jgi:CRP/FNR family transcriptional regulator
MSDTVCREAGEEASVDHAFDVLRRSPLFEALDPADAAALQAGMATVDIARGEVLFAEGVSGHELYVIIDGKMKLTRAAADGRENLLQVLGPGEMFGELSMFDPRPRTSSAVAVTDTRLGSLDHEFLRPWLTGRPDVALHLLQALAQRLRRANDVTADRFGEPQDQGLQVHHDLTQEELAQLVGASRETVNKALADFAARGWLQLSAKSVLLIEPERLRKRSR